MMRKTPNSNKIPVNIVGGSVFGRYQKISSEKTYNMFISDGWLVNFAGYQRFVQLLQSGRGRGLFHSIRENILICVVNSAVYRIDTEFNPTFLGSLETTYGEVYIDENLNNQICLVDGVHAYIYNTTLPPNLTVQPLSDVPMGITFVPNYVQFHDTYFLFGNGATGNSGSYWFAFAPSGSDPTLIDYVQSFKLQTKPDFAIAVKRIPSQGANVIVFGTAVCEIYTNVASSDANNFYRRNSTINVDYGCLNVSTISSSEEYIAWLGVNESNAPAIMVYSGQGIEKISTDGIDYVMGQLKYPQQSTATFYRQDGHLFYQITFFNPADNITLVYDFNTKLFFHLSDADLNCHPAVDIVYFNQNSYFISLRNASLYQMNTNITVFDENLPDVVTPDPNLISDIPRTRICKSIRSDDSQRFVANGLTVTIEQGMDEAVSDASIEEANLSNVIPYRPRVDLSISYDGGVTFSNTVGRELNPIGKRRNILQWENMGAANDLTMKFKFWGMSRFVVNDAVAEVR